MIITTKFNPGFNMIYCMMWLKMVENGGVPYNIYYKKAFYKQVLIYSKSSKLKKINIFKKIQKRIMVIISPNRLYFCMRLRMSFKYI